MSASTGGADWKRVNKAWLDGVLLDNAMLWKEVRWQRQEYAIADGLLCLYLNKKELRGPVYERRDET